MREPTFLVLASLADESRHGYAIMNEVESLSAGRIKLRAGTLYGALDRLTREGLVSEVGQEVVNGRLRRYYALTDDGARRLEAETARMSENARQASGRLKLRRAQA